jgi:dipeptidyl aminopeptidase/acylaminoacyl peptidase
MFCTACASFSPVAAPRCAACGSATGPRGWAAEAGRPPRRRVLRLLYVAPLLALLATGGLGLERYRADRADLAAWYALGAAAAAEGRYPEAIDAFAAAGGYRDADDRRAEAAAALAPYRVAYLDGLAALEGRRYDDAIAALLPVVRDLPGYRDGAARLAEARRGRAEALRHAAAEAEAKGDWLGAERALAALAAADPDDAALAGRLAALRRAHAPLVLARDEALYLVGPDGTDQRLVTDEVPAAWPAWSPDRTRIAFVSVDTSNLASTTGLYVVDADGTDLRRLAEEVGVYPPPVWSPDGTRLAYTSFAGWNSARDRGTISVRVVELATGRETDLTAAELALAIHPAWSPTGDRVAFVTKYRNPGEGIDDSPGDVYAATLATGELENLTDGRVPDAWRLAWSPTDERLLVYTARSQTWYEPARMGIRLLHARTGALSTVTAGSQNISVPVWSPDGSRFAFVEGSSVVRVRAQGRGETWINVAHPISDFVSWSPDGSALLAAAVDPKQPSILLPLDEGPGAQVPVQLRYDVDYPSMGPPVWSPATLDLPAGPPSVAGTARDPVSRESGVRSQE